ncbi:MAG: hypothetical protein RJA16_1890, partial [Planctomycetota bacterium]
MRVGALGVRGVVGVGGDGHAAAAIDAADRGVAAALGERGDLRERDHLAAAARDPHGFDAAEPPSALLVEANSDVDVLPVGGVGVGLESEDRGTHLPRDVGDAEAERRGAGLELDLHLALRAEVVVGDVEDSRQHREGFAQLQDDRLAGGDVVARHLDGDVGPARATADLAEGHELGAVDGSDRVADRIDHLATGAVPLLDRTQFDDDLRDVRARRIAAARVRVGPLADEEAHRLEFGLIERRRLDAPRLGERLLDARADRHAQVDHHRLRIVGGEKGEGHPPARDHAQAEHERREGERDHEVSPFEAPREHSRIAGDRRCDHPSVPPSPERVAETDEPASLRQGAIHAVEGVAHVGRHHDERLDQAHRERAEHHPRQRAHEGSDASLQEEQRQKRHDRGRDRGEDRPSDLFGTLHRGGRRILAVLV